MYTDTLIVFSPLPSLFFFGKFGKAGCNLENSIPIYFQFIAQYGPPPPPGSSSEQG